VLGDFNDSDPLIPAAASLLLYGGSREMPFNLDGAGAEGYTESYQVLVLEKFEKLNSVLDQPGEILVAKRICIDLQKYNETKDLEFKKRTQVLIRQLDAKGLGRFASEKASFPHAVPRRSL
jgi:hypothetical protein